MADFLNKLRGQLDAGIAKVTTKSRVTIETTRLHAQIRKITKDKDDALARLGARVYQDMVQQGNVDQSAIANDVQQIGELDRSLAAVRQEITRLEALDAATPWSAPEETHPIATCTCGAPLTEEMQFCGECGVPTQEIIARVKAEQQARVEAPPATASIHCPQCHTEISATAKFCRGCGATLTPQHDASTVPANTSHCPSCGNEIVATARFCRHCGQAVVSASPATPMHEDNVEAPHAEQIVSDNEMPTVIIRDLPKSDQGDN